jgi:hypothetical protein
MRRYSERTAPARNQSAAEKSVRVLRAVNAALKA